jgi:hypothetical protein
MRDEQIVFLQPVTEISTLILTVFELRRFT